MAEDTIIRATISMDSELQKRLTELAEKDKRSFSQMCAILLQEAIDKRENNNPNL